MEEKIVPDFSIPIDRSGTDAEKLDSRKLIFGNEAVQPLWVADMDLPSPPFLQQALIKRIKHQCFGYTTQSDRLKGAIQWWMLNEHDLNISNDSIMLSPSVVTTFNNAIKTFSGAGDGVALFSPVYGPFYFAIKNHNRTLVDIPLLLTNEQYRIDLELFEKECSAGNIKLLLLCNPQNPSGRLWQENELKQLVDICKTNGVKIISDEIHSDIVYAGNRHYSILSIDGAEDISLVAHSIGKTFNTSGLQASFIICPNSNMCDQYQQTAELSHTNDINLLGKIAIETVFSVRGQVYKNALIDYLTENQNLLLERLSKIPVINPMRSESTFLSWINFSNTGLTHAKISKKLIDDAGLGLGGGLFYGPIGRGWFRLNFAVARCELDKAIKNIENVFC